MGPKTFTWALGLVIIACSLSAVCSDHNRTSSSTVPSSSSSSYGRPVSKNAVKNQQRTRGNGTQVRRLAYKNAARGSRPQQQSRVTSRRLVVKSSSNVTLTKTIGTIVIRASSTHIFQSRYVEIKEYAQIIPPRVVLSLTVADRFRTNVMYIIGYLLQSRRHLNAPTYDSLNIIYKALQRRQVFMYRLLPVLIKLRGQSKSVQFHTIMSELSKYLPQYYACSALYWVGILEKKYFNIDTAIVNSQESFDLFRSITEKDIGILQKFNGSDEMAPYDYDSARTEMMMGQVYVKIFNSIKTHKLHLSQQLFALILRNLPNFDVDVTFEEYIIFVAEIAWRNEIPNWEQKGINLNPTEPVLLIQTISERINSDIKVSSYVRRAMHYISTHLSNIKKYGSVNNGTYLITGNGGLQITYLLSLINIYTFGHRAVEMKQALLQFSSEHTDVIELILSGMNRFAYLQPHELLKVFLIRLETRLSYQYEYIRHIVIKLITIVEERIVIWRVEEKPPEDTTTPQPSSTDHPSGPTKAPTGKPHPGTNPTSSSTEYSTATTQRGGTYPSSNTGHTTGITQSGDTDHPSSTTEYSTPITKPGGTSYSTGHTKGGPGVTHPSTDHPSGSTEYSTATTQPGGHPASTTKYSTAPTKPGDTRHPSSSTEYSTKTTKSGGTGNTVTSTGHSTRVTQPGVTDQTTSSSKHSASTTHPGGTGHPGSSTEHSTAPTKPGETRHPASSTEHSTAPTKPGETRYPGSSTIYSTASTQSAGTEYTAKTTTRPGVTGHPASSTEHSTAPTKPGETRHPASSTIYSTASTQSAGTEYTVKTTTRPGSTGHPASSTKHSTAPTKPGETRHPASSTEHSTAPTKPGGINQPSITTGIHVDHSSTTRIPGGTDQPSSTTEYSIPITQPGGSSYSTGHTKGGTAVTHPTNHTKGVTGITQPSTDLSPRSTEYSTATTQPGGTGHPASSTEYSTAPTKPGQTRNPSRSTEYSTAATQPGGTNHPSVTTRINVDHSSTVTSSPTGLSTRSPIVPPTVPPAVPPHILVDVPALPKGVNPKQVIRIEINQYFIPIFVFGTTNYSTNVVTVPSVYCLQLAPGAGNSQNGCETETEILIRTQLINTFGKDYIQVILGNNWRERYTTTISFYVALLKNLETNVTIQRKQELLTIIRRYKIAIESVATYVNLPVIIRYQNITTEIVWSTFDVTNPWTSHIGSFRPKANGTHIVTVPLVNPKYWFEPVDLNNPYEGLFPVLPANDPYAKKLLRLITIFNTKEIHKWLGINWNPSVYPNRGALFITALRILLTQEDVQNDKELMTLIQDYLRAIELPAVNVKIPPNIFETIQINMLVPALPVPIPAIENVIPAEVNPENKIRLVVSDTNILHIEFLETYEEVLPIQNVLTLPSVVCLAQAPSTGNVQDKCEKDVDIHIKQIFVQKFGDNYIEIILGRNATHVYSTRISLLIALIEKVQSHPKMLHEVDSLKIIRRYEIALKSVASYILLPLAVHYHKITTPVVWFWYNAKSPSQINFSSQPSDQQDIISLPLINPVTWVLPVDDIEPFSGLIPIFADPESSFAVLVQPLHSILRSVDIYDILGDDWKVSQFQTRGALYVSVLYRLLTTKKANAQLKGLLEQYLKAIEVSTINIHFTNEYLTTIINRWKLEYFQTIRHEDPIVANVTAREDILLPALIVPNKDLRVTMKSPTRIYVQSSRALEQRSSDTLTLPSVNCLQAFPDQDDDEYCEHFPDLPMLPQLVETIGEAGTEKLMNENWDSEYPTMAAFLQNLCLKAVENEKVAKNKKLVADINRYRLALEFTAASIFLPLLTNYQEIDVELIWLNYDTTDYRQSHMSLHRTETGNEAVVTLPLVNPKIWLQSVNVKHPFTSFLPILPASDPYAAKIKPLLQLFNSGEILQILGNTFTPANYPNRGALLLATLRTLLDSPIVASKKELRALVESYFNAIQVVSLYVHIPRSWINNGYTKANGYTWNIDIADLYTALPVARTDEERTYSSYIYALLHIENLRERLDIQLPALTTYKAEFIMMIIKRLLVSTNFKGLDENYFTALRYYSAKSEIALVAGGGVVHWIWVPRVQSVIISQQTTVFDLGKIFVITIPLTRLKTKQDKLHYFELIKFMNDNQNLLNSDDFMYKRYPNMGQFLRAYLNHLARRPNIDAKVKQYINTVVEFVRNTGPGATRIIQSQPLQNSKH